MKEKRNNLTILTIPSIVLLIMAVILVVAVAIIRYRSDEVNYRNADAVLGLGDVSVRGYMNCLFDRGIYEFIDGDRLKGIAINKKRQYAVLINIENIAHGNIYDLGGATVYDILSGDITTIYAEDGEIKKY